LSWHHRAGHDRAINATARKIGWNDVDFFGSTASYDLFVARLRVA